MFTFAQKESAESILSEPGESDDEIFGSHGSNKLPVPTLPEMPPSPPPPPTPAPKPVPAYQPQVQAYPQPVPVPVPVPLQPVAGGYPQPAAIPVMPVAQQSTAIKDNPFSFEAESPAAAEPLPVAAVSPQPLPIPIETEEVAEKQAARKKAERTPPAATASGGINKGLFFAVVGYAVLVTGLAVYGLFFKPTEKLDPGHPLSTIPDNFGEFDPASRKKVSRYSFPVDGELPASLKAGLGGKIEVGQLEIEPLKVEARDLNIISEGRGEKRTDHRGRALVLHLRIKNVSPDLSIFPMDPAFTRQSRGDDKPITRLLAGKQTFFGGAIEWPFPSAVKRRYEEQQEKDATPLKPDESREYVVFTAADPKVEKAVKDAGDSLLWRVQVRRGLISFKGKDVPVTAVIGVEFSAGDVKGE